MGSYKKYGYPIISKEVSEAVQNARLHILGGGTIDITKKYLEVPQRIQKLFGILRKRGIPEKSIYNLEKWKPLIDMPFKISNKCCKIMKKNPVNKFGKYTGLKPIIGTMAEESRLRTQQWLKNGCNGFNMKSPVSNPISFWKEQDVLRYIKENNIKIPSVYGEIINADNPFEDGIQLQMCDCGKLKTSKCQRTGCMYCAYGVHLEKGKTRFQMLKETHPKIYEYCMNGGEFENGLWVPNQNGLGLKFVFDKINEVYGQGFIKY